MGEINYEMKYAYAEIDAIIELLGDAYRRKIPTRILEKIKNEKRHGYRPQFDLSKPLEQQITRGETFNLLAYLFYYFWCDNENVKTALVERINGNAKTKEKYEEEKRQEEIRRRATAKTQSLDEALKNRFM